MINPIKSYEDIGRRAGTAARKRDYTTSRSHDQHMHRMLRLEDASDRPAARAAYRSAYRKAAHNA